MHRLRLSLVAFLAATLALGLAGPASADPKPSPPGGGGVGIAALSQYDPPGTIYCYTQPAPAPQYSSSGGVYGQVHWGGAIFCNWPGGTLRFTMKLWTVVGTGDNEHKVWQDEHAAGPKVDYALEHQNWQTTCIFNTSTRWITSIAATFDGLPFTPSTAWSNVYTLPCGSGD